MHQRGEVWSDAATCAPSEAHFFFCLFCSQRGKEEYKLAATSDGEAKKAKKGKGQKDVDDLKKEVDLVSRRAIVSRLARSSSGTTLKNHLINTRRLGGPS